MVGAGADVVDVVRTGKEQLVGVLVGTAVVARYTSAGTVVIDLVLARTFCVDRDPREKLRKLENSTEEYGS